MTHSINHVKYGKVYFLNYTFDLIKLDLAKWKICNSSRFVLPHAVFVIITFINIFLEMRSIGILIQRYHNSKMNL